ncbi:hypothetical protein ACQUSY_03560 [Microbacterium sp. YY-03]|uniref:hypothetical protein n=1 Tax=Microbacterium sp. YY-03 TaxID=3421636 RepID=UPI003D18725C
MTKKLFATVLCAAALAVASPTLATAAPVVPATMVPSVIEDYGTYIEKPVEGFFPNANICNAERLSFKSQGYWTGGCFYSATNRGWGFYYG